MISPETCISTHTMADLATLHHAFENREGKHWAG